MSDADTTQSQKTKFWSVFTNILIGVIALALVAAAILDGDTTSKSNNTTFTSKSFGS